MPTQIPPWFGVAVLRKRTLEVRHMFDGYDISRPFKRGKYTMERFELTVPKMPEPTSTSDLDTAGYKTRIVPCRANFDLYEEP